LHESNFQNASVSTSACDGEVRCGAVCLPCAVHNRTRCRFVWIGRHGRFQRGHHLVRLDAGYWIDARGHDTEDWGHFAGIWELWNGFWELRTGIWNGNRWLKTRVWRLRNRFWELRTRIKRTRNGFYEL